MKPQWGKAKTGTWHRAYDALAGPMALCEVGKIGNVRYPPHYLSRSSLTAKPKRSGSICRRCERMN